MNMIEWMNVRTCVCFFLGENWMITMMLKMMKSAALRHVGIEISFDLICYLLVWVRNVDDDWSFVIKTGNKAIVCIVNYITVVQTVERWPIQFPMGSYYSHFF